MGLLDKYQKQEPEKITASFTLDEDVYSKLIELRKKRKLKKISPLVNDLLKDWIKRLEKEMEVVIPYQK